MAASFVALPAEILENVLESLERVDHVNLLATCRQLQALVAPFVFQSVSFTAGGVKSTAGSALLAVRRYGILVRELRVKVAPPICADDDCITCKWAGIWDWGLFMEPSQAIAESALEKQNRWLSPDAATLLAADRAMLPSRPRLVVEFPRSLLTHYGAYHRPEQRNLQNPDECVVYRSGIRATAVFEALSRGQTNHDDGAGRAFGRLSVLNFALQLDPGFSATDAWRRFLGGVEHLELTLQGEVSPLDENPVYRELLEQLGGVFFKHLSAVQRLRFEAHEMGPMGTRSHDHDQQLFPFELSDMPALQELELANVVIGPGLTHRLLSGLRRGPCTLKFSNATVQSLEATMYPPLTRDTLSLAARQLCRVFRRADGCQDVDSEPARRPDRLRDSRPRGYATEAPRRGRHHCRCPGAPRIEARSTSVCIQLRLCRRRRYERPPGAERMGLCRGARPSGLCSVDGLGGQRQDAIWWDMKHV